MSSKGTAAVPVVNGQRPVATQVLATTDWQGMEIQEQTRTPVRFIIFSGHKEQMVNPAPGASFHLMIMLNDAHTGQPIPYSSSVWATITNRSGKVVFDEDQWPMISRYMGPHYGNDVPYLPSGRYKLSVLVSPPALARTAEYRNVWLSARRINTYFDWNAKTGSATVLGAAAKSSSSSSMSGMAGMSGMSGMAGMSVPKNLSVNGVRATASQAIATAYWQGMKIQARTAAPTPFYLYNGAGVQSVEPVAHSSFYLMVMLNDRQTNQAITYAPVYATIKSAAGKVVYRGNLEPTISAFAGPYYGNNVHLPQPGPYTLELRIDPPAQARHLEYEHVWLKPHVVVEHFAWDGTQ